MKVKANLYISNDIDIGTTVKVYDIKKEKNLDIRNGGSCCRKSQTFLLGGSCHICDSSPVEYESIVTFLIHDGSQFAYHNASYFDEIPEYMESPLYNTLTKDVE